MTNQLPPGRILNNNCYRIISFIGQGGFGITYLAEEIGYYRVNDLGTAYVKFKQPEKVVVKELYFDSFCQRDEATGLVSITSGANKEQFDKLVNKQLEEGRILIKLNHDHIVKTRNIFKENDTAYMVMDFVDGISLADLIQKGGKLDRDKSIGYIRQVLSAVIYIHQRKILHLDITPSNILVESQTDQAILIDFGASLTYGENDHVSANTSKLVAGRAKYYTPVEQMELDNLMDFDAMFDTYAVGATLYHMLTGTPPPVASLLVSGRQKLIPPSAISQTSGITDYLDNIIIKALNSHYDERYKTAAELDNDLDNESKYRYQLNLINKLLAENNYPDALAETKKGIELFGMTASFSKLTGLAEETLKQDGSEKRYELLWHQAMEELVDNNYEKALSLFEQAAKLFPERKEASAKINFCSRKITEGAQQQKIALLLNEVKKNTRNGDDKKAIALLDEILVIEPDNELARVMQQELQRTQNQQQPGYTPPPPVVPPVVPPAEPFIQVAYEPEDEVPGDDHSQKTQVLNAEAHELISNGEYEKAGQKLRESASLNPNNKATEILTQKLKDKIQEAVKPNSYAPAGGGFKVPPPPPGFNNTNRNGLLKQYKEIWWVLGVILVLFILLCIFYAIGSSHQPDMVAADSVKMADSALAVDSAKMRDSSKMTMVDTTKKDTTKKMVANNTSGPVDLYETFDDNANVWDLADNASDNIAINDGELRMEGLDTGSAYCSVPYETINTNKNYTCSVKAKWLDGVNDHGFGIVFVSDRTFRYDFIISGNGYYCIYYNKGGVTKIVNWTSSDLINQGSVTNTLTVKRIGDHIYFYINGNKITSIWATSGYGPYFGLTVEDKQTVSFYDFQLKGAAN